MLEIPESHTIAQQCNQTIKGKTITKVLANSSPHGFAFYHDNPDSYPFILEGKTITQTIAYAGMVEIEAENTRILFGDGINIRYFESNTQIQKKHQLYIEFDDTSSLICTVQMYGGIWAYFEGDNKNPYYCVAKEKPLPLKDEFNESYFIHLFDNLKPTLSLKAFLATEQRIPGLGNGVLHDILFNAGLNPKDKIHNINKNEKEKLFISIKETLKKMTDLGGRDTEKDLFGNNGGYQSILSHKTYKEPCCKCGNSIARQTFLGGNIYYCATCQAIKNS